MNIKNFLEESCQRIGDKNVFSILTLKSDSNIGVVESITGNNFLKNVATISKTLQISEIFCKKVFFISENSIPLLTTYFACLNNSCMVSIADIKLTAQELNQIIDNFQPDVIIAEKTKIDFCRQLHFFSNKQSKLLAIEDLLSVPDNTLKSLSSTVSLAATATPKVVVYTSGTSGNAKGVVLDVSSLIFEAQSLMDSFERDYQRRKCFSILPLNHVYGMTTAIFTSLWADQEVFLTQSLAPNHIRQIIQEHKPFYLYVVPQFLAVIKNKVFDSLNKKPPMTQRIAKLAIKINSRLKSRKIANFFFSEIRDQIGPSLDFIISGGAPLDEDIFDFFEAIAIPVCNGYGLTETGPVVCMNTLKFRRKGSVGKTIKGVNIKVEPETQELLVNGPNVFTGYFQNPELTAESIHTEITADQTVTWFKTGDLISYDADGFLYIQGRSKSMIVLPSGKKVQPEEVELHFSKLSFIKNCCLVFGHDNQSALNKLFLIIELDSSVIDLSRKQILEKLIEHSNALASFKKPQGYKFTTTPLPLTTTLKVRRFLVEKNLSDYKD